MPRMTIYDLTVAQLSKMLRNLDGWLTAAAAHADKKKFSVDTLLHARLAPDQFHFARQVQAACDNAKFVCGRLAGKDYPSHPDTETTVEQLHARIVSVLQYLGTLKPEDFTGAETKQIALPFLQGKHYKGEDYLVQFGLPNFYFHVTHAYAILRHNGVELGKRDYLGQIPSY